MDRTDWRLSPGEAKAMDSEVGRNAYTEAKFNDATEQEARDAAVAAYEDRCVYCGGSGVRCCEFGRERR